MLESSRLYRDSRRKLVALVLVHARRASMQPSMPSTAAGYKVSKKGVRLSLVHPLLRAKFGWH